MRQASADHARSKRRIGLRRLKGVNHAGPQPQSNRKEFLLREIADRIQEVLGFKQPVQNLLDTVLERGFIKRRMKNIGIDGGIEQMRTSHDGARKLRRAA